MAFFSIRPDRNQPAGWRILTVADIPFYVQPSFLLFIGLIFFSQVDGGGDLSRAGLLCFVIFFSLLAHEAGHALMAHVLGYRDITVSLVMFGGQTSHPASTRGHSLLIVLAGPLVTLGIFALAWGTPRVFPGLITTSDGPGAYLLSLVLFINLIWAIFNLIPIYPLDGGQALLSLLSYVFSYPQALLIVAVVSLVLCALCGLWALRLGQFFILILVVIFFLQNLQILRMFRKN